MIGVILAAGIGSRLRPITSTKPKCLVTTAGKPILQYQIDAYRFAGIRDLIIVIGYEGERIVEYCKHIRDMNIRFIENSDYEGTNNMYSLYLTKDLLSGRPFILNNADLSVDESIVKQLIDFESENAIAVDTSSYSEESMKVTVDKAGRIIDISKAIPEANSHAASIDFYKFSADSGKILFDEIVRIVESEDNKKDWTEVAMQRLFQAGKLNFLPCDIRGSRWTEIDNYQDLAYSDRIFTGFDDAMSGIDTILMDLDGTVYVGNEQIPGAASTINKLKKSGRRVYFLSNNSSRSKSAYVQKLNQMGIESEEGDIILSTDGLLEYLKNQEVERVYVLGTDSLRQSIEEIGVRTDSENPEFVVVGYDTELTYQKLREACRHINSDVDILATHCDVFCPSEVGPIPDIGALLEMLRMTTGKTPIKVFGKPTQDMISCLQSGDDFDPRKALFIGDRLHTDMLMASNSGAHGLLVLTGETKREDLEETSADNLFVLNSIVDIFQ